VDASKIEETEPSSKLRSNATESTLSPGSAPKTKSAKRPKQVCEWRTQREAFSHFASTEEDTQSQRHIKPVHWYIACRLVLEGGFRPEEVYPRPPFSSEKNVLVYKPELASHRELTVVGGIKTKNVDVVIDKLGVGPTIAVSCKGITGAFRNLTNRLEETIGECNNLHLGYSGLVFGYLFLARAQEKIEETAAAIEAGMAEKQDRNDLAFTEDGDPVDSLLRFYNAMETMNRRMTRTDPDGKYESVGFGLVRVDPDPGTLSETFPPKDSTVNLEHFFSVLYTRYEERYVIAAPSIKHRTRRCEWDVDSPAFKFGQPGGLPGRPDYTPRLADPARRKRRGRASAARTAAQPPISMLLDSMNEQLGLKQTEVKP
jgi:hypothetical protein